MPEAATAQGANAAPAAPATPEAAGVPTSPIEDGFANIPMDAVSDIDAPVPGERPAEQSAEPGEKAPEKGAQPAKDAGKEGGDDPAKAGDDKLDRFDRHPRFQELLGKVRDLTRQLAETRGEIQGRPGQGPQNRPQAPEKLPYVDITTKTDDELREWQEDDPKGYAANLYRQMEHELERAFVSKAQAARTRAEAAARQEAVRGAFQKYEKENPDFRPMWDSGQIMEFMSKNPGHNAISAHMALTRQAAVDAAVKAAAEKAAKETEERVRKDFLAKKNAAVIQDGGAPRATGELPDELKDPGKYGGRVAAGAERLRRLRAGGTA